MTTSCTQTAIKGPSCSLGNPLTALLLPRTPSRLLNMCTREMHFRAPDAEVGVVSANWAKKIYFCRIYRSAVKLEMS